MREKSGGPPIVRKGCTDWLTLPGPVAVTVTLKVPACVPAGAFTLITVFIVPEPLTFKLDGLNVAVAELGSPDAKKLTVPLKLFIGVIEIVYPPGLVFTGGVSVSVLGETPMLKFPVACTHSVPYAG